MEKHIAIGSKTMALIVGPIFWLIGSVHNISQLIYETTNVHVQILNKCVQLPLLLPLLVGSLLFLVAGGHAWIWLCLPGSVLFFAGGLTNAVRVIAMQRMERVTIDKLRGSA
ncbi:hypothetical protein ZIOFF_076090 [Zingiber officinale]|uniref:Uncharacterized protein n=1 Tax=Zingiber officinale TaxID=94328 RepID=A0A8J5E821_ZINOF|nr:hypothetical protein ZIOFF_076090 [Zingiber officinale]